jgi:hypothetical protein
MSTVKWLSIVRLLDSQSRPCIHWPNPIGIRPLPNLYQVSNTAIRIVELFQRAVDHRGCIIAHYILAGGMYVRHFPCNALPLYPEYYSPGHIIDTTDDLAIERFKLKRAALAYQQIQLGFYDGKHLQG